MKNAYIFIFLYSIFIAAIQSNECSYITLEEINKFYNQNIKPENLYKEFIENKKSLIIALTKEKNLLRFKEFICTDDFLYDNNEIILPWDYWIEAKYNDLINKKIELPWEDILLVLKSGEMMDEKDPKKFNTFQHMFIKQKNNKIYPLIEFHYNYHIKRWEISGIRVLRL